MENKKRRLVILGVLFGVVTALFLGTIFTLYSEPQAAVAQTEPDTVASAQRTIQVSGIGRVSVQPDRATVRLGVTTEAISATTALEENSMRMSDLISVTQEAGIPAASIQTEGLTLQPIYENDVLENGTRTLTGYRATNMVSITTDDIAGLGALLDAIVGAGGNTIQGIRFEISDSEAALAQAREAAVNDARNRAEQLTNLLGTQLGDVLTIIEFGGSAPSAIQFDQAIAESAAVPVAAGSQVVEVSIQVTWQLEGE